MIRLYRNVADAIVTALAAILTDGQLADRVVDHTLRQHPKWGARDRHAFADAVYEVVRWKRLLAYAAARPETDYWALLAAHLVRRGADSLPDWPEFAGLDLAATAARVADPTLPLAVRESVPDWLAAPPGLPAEVAARWPAELAAQNGQAPVTLRVNTLKGTVAQAAARLRAEGIETEPVPGLPLALRLPERRPVTRTRAFQEGWVEVQDGGSQHIVPLLRAEPGMRVLDACAGGGGKTLHLAGELRGKGEIRALDIAESRLGELRRRADRAGAKNIQTALADDATRQALTGWADRLLLDAPCTGTGTLRRQPDLKWRLTPAFAAEIGQIQRRILLDYPQMLRPGGLLVYATCSLLPQEGEAVVRERLAAADDLELLEEHRIWTSETDDDGFYAAVLRKR